VFLKKKYEFQFASIFSCLLFKGQLISKANCQAVNSSKKRTNEFVFTTLRHVYVCFLEEIEINKKTFRNYLTFRNSLLKIIEQISSMLLDCIKSLVTLGVEAKVQNKIISQEVNKSFFPYFLSILSPHPPDYGSFS
jgi:hypothetical protein